MRAIVESDASIDGVQHQTMSPLPSPGSSEDIVLEGDTAVDCLRRRHPPPSHVLCL